MDKIKSKEETKNKITSISKVLYAFALIGRVLCYLSIVVVVIGMIMTPVISKNISLENNTITVFNEKFEFKINNVDILEIKHNDKKTYTINTEEIGLTKVPEIIGNTSVKKITYYIEFAFICAIIKLVLMSLILRKLEKIFDNISKNATPFYEKNPEYIKSILKISIIYIIFEVVSTFIFSVFTNFNISINLNITLLLVILMIAFLAYVFEYGYILEKKSK